MDQGLGVVGIGGEPAVHLGQLAGAPGLVLAHLAHDAHSTRRLRTVVLRSRLSKRALPSPVPLS